jgi:enoyl-CoA hydratase
MAKGASSDMFEYDTLAVTVSKAVARIDLNRPDKGNCLNAVMWRELGEVFHAMASASDIRVVILGGAGSHFSTGIDLDYLAGIGQELGQLPEGRKQEVLRHAITELQASVNAIEACPKPVLAAICGFCIGAGVDIATACDMRYATASTRFSVKEVDLSIVADLGSLQRLPRIVGEGSARELAFTGRQFKGEEARAMGLVNRLFADKTDLDDGVMALAEQLAQKSPLTMRGIKETMNFSRDHSIHEGLTFVANRNAAMLLSEDLTEAMRAHLERRRPCYND